MNIEESIEILKNSKNLYLKDSDILEEAIETLLTAYEKEKEKNKELIKERATEIVYVDKNFVRKDKIKAKIEEYYEYDKRMQNKPDWHTTKYYEAKALEKLLEE